MSLIHLMGLKKVLKNSTTVNLDNGAKTATTYSIIFQLAKIWNINEKGTPVRQQLT